MWYAPVNVLDLFSGIGGFSLGLERAGFTTVAMCEADETKRGWLRQHWPEIPIYDDVRTLNANPWLGAVDLVCGGFPCQDISQANHRAAGIDGDRSGLYSEIVRIVGECRPGWVLLENSPRLRTRGIDRVLSDLEEQGYTARPLVVGAWHVGAPHQRDRVWIIANTDEEQLREQSRRRRRTNREMATEPENPARLAHGHGQPFGPIDAKVANGPEIAADDAEPWSWWNGGPGHHLRLDDGLSSRLATRKAAAFGNSVVPLIPELIGRSILAAHNEFVGKLPGTTGMEVQG